MKNTKLNLSIFALVVAVSFAIANSSAVNANKLWRFDPQTGQEVQPSDCMIQSEDLCANEYTDDGEFIRPVEAVYTGD